MPLYLFRSAQPLLHCYNPNTRKTLRLRQPNMNLEMARKKFIPLAVPPDPQIESRLCSITPEIRKRIWEFVLAVELDADGNFEWNWKGRKSGATRPDLTFLQTCRLIYKEAAGIFFTTVDLRMTGRLAGHRLNFRNLTLLQGVQMGGLRTVKIEVVYLYVEAVTMACKYFSTLPRLDTLSFILHNEWKASIGIPIQDVRRSLEKERYRLVHYMAMMKSTKSLTFETTWKLDPSNEWDREVRKVLNEIIAIMPYAKAQRRVEEDLIEG